MISNWKKPFDLHELYKNTSALQGLIRRSVTPELTLSETKASIKIQITVVYLSNTNWSWLISVFPAIKSQKTVTVYFLSEQLQSFIFAGQYIVYV